MTHDATGPGDVGVPRRDVLRLLGAGAAGMGLAGPAAAGRLQDAAEAPTSAETWTADAIEHAERAAGVRFTNEERAQFAADLSEQVAGFRVRRAFALSNGTAPATVFDPRAGADRLEPRAARAPAFRRSRVAARPLPGDEAAIAFAPVTELSRWIASGALSSERLTRIYLDRLRRYGPKLECVVTITAQRALDSARRADAEIGAGRYRGPLHGIPWGAKDLFDTAGTPTTWGAKPYRNRKGETDAHAVRALEEAGAVLVAKLSLGALAYGDIWYGGKTRNPWDPTQGSSGSSAGSAAATAAGLVGFSLGTETYGSIVSPCMRCGTTGLRPTFGRVGRTGAMALCWSLDKIGPITRSVEDAAMVFGALCGPDPGDPSWRPGPLDFDAGAGVAGVRVGYRDAWFEGADVGDRAALEALAREGAEPVDLDAAGVAPPDGWPYGSLLTILFAEAAAAFEELTLTDRDDELVWQEPQAWPNTFRRTWLVPAIELVQADRFRRRVMEMMRAVYERVDVLVSPSFAGGLLLITNMTGHPALTVPRTFDDDGRPRGVTLWGGLDDEGALCRAGMALERAFGVRGRRPPGFD